MVLSESSRIHSIDTRAQRNLLSRLEKEANMARMRLYVFLGAVVLVSIFLRTFVFTYSESTTSVHGYYDAHNNVHIFEKNLHECGTVTDTEQAITVVDCRTENGDTVKKTLHRIDLIVHNSNVLATMWYKDRTVYLNNGHTIPCRSNQDRPCYVEIYHEIGPNQTTVKKHDVSLPGGFFQNTLHSVNTIAFKSGIGIVVFTVLRSVAKLYNNR